MYADAEAVGKATVSPMQRRDKGASVGSACGAMLHSTAGRQLGLALRLARTFLIYLPVADAPALDRKGQLSMNVGLEHLSALAVY